MGNRANNLSGGEQQRVAIARSLINQPRIILADEPTGNLDTETSEAVKGLLRDINRDLKTTFIIVTHDRHIAAGCDRVVEIEDGAVKRDFLPVEMSEDESWARAGALHLPGADPRPPAGSGPGLKPHCESGEDRVVGA